MPETYNESLQTYSAGIFDEYCENKNRIPRTGRVMERVIENAKEEAIQVQSKKKIQREGEGGSRGGREGESE